MKEFLNVCVLPETTCTDVFTDSVAVCSGN